MKVRDSGMPDEEMWTGFFDPAKVLATLGLDCGLQDIVEFGCGYGTFTLAAAAIASGTVHALDIEPDMITIVQQKCHDAGVRNVEATLRDFVAAGSGLAENSMDAALLFNILHHEEPVTLMKEAFRVLKPNGMLAVIHWNYDPTTPRGPPPPPGAVHRMGKGSRVPLQGAKPFRPAALSLRTALQKTLHLIMN